MKLERSGGFTIIEMMISIGIFLIVVTVGMTALLNASAIHQKSQDQRSIMDSLNFIMDEMSRNIRTGIGYDCTDSVGNASGTPGNCSPGAQGISFTSSGGTPVAYYFNNHNLEKNTGGGNLVQLNPNDLNNNGVIFDSASGFSITGAGLSTTDNLQPFVTIHLIGTITTKGVATPFSLQTSVSQRQVDI